MGLFDFLKGTGHKLFSSDAEAAQKIQEHIRTSDVGIDNLKVRYKHGTVYLSGNAKTPEALQKAVLIAGNIQGVESVDVEGIQVPAHLPNPKDVEHYHGTQYYTIQSGDTLSKIAQRFYGSTDKYSKIYEANLEVIKNPNLIYPGQKIRIPAEQYK